MAKSLVSCFLTDGIAHTKSAQKLHNNYYKTAYRVDQIPKLFLKVDSFATVRVGKRVLCQELSHRNENIKI